MARQTKQKQAEVWECVEPHATDIDGKLLGFRRGDRIGGDHPARRQNPEFWAPFGHSTVGQPPHSGFAEPEPEPEQKPEPRVRAKRNMRIRGVVLEGGLLAEGMTIINAGDELPRSHPAVKARPKDFEAVA